MKDIHITIYTKEKWKLEFTSVKEWWNFDKKSVSLHREGGPAVVWGDGRQEYWLNDKRHRTDGPAVIWSDKGEEYWFNGKRHREDGPAVVWIGGAGSYYLNGMHHTEEEYYKKLEEIDNLPLSLKLIHNEWWVRERVKKVKVLF